jgi:hypothetical protein
MTAIAALTETYEGGTANAGITTGNTGFTSIVGSPTFTASAYHGSLAGLFSTTGAQEYAEIALSPTKAKFWIKFAFFVPASPPAAICNIIDWYAGSQKVGTLKLNTSNALKLQDGSPAGGVNLAWSQALTAGAWAEIAILVDTTGSGKHQVRVYQGANLGTATATSDSGALTLTNTGTAISKVDRGVITATPLSLIFDAERADDTTEPASIAPPGAPPPSTLALSLSANPANPVDPFAPVAITATVTGGTGPFSHALTMTSGPLTLAITGSGPVWTFWAPACIFGPLDFTFSDTVTDSVSATATDTAAIEIAPANSFVMIGGQWVAYQEANRVDGAWTDYYPGAPLVDPTTLPAPSGFTATGGATGATASFSWTQVTDPSSTHEPITGYQIMAGTTIVKTVGRVGSTTIAGLPDGLYDYTVVAITALRYSAPSTDQTFTIGTPPALNAPTGFTATLNGGVATCSWTNPSDPTAGEPILTCSVVDTGGNVLASVSAPTDTVDVALVPGTHVLAVIAATGLRSSGPSNTTTVTV